MLALILKKMRVLQRLALIYQVNIEERSSQVQEPDKQDISNIANYY